VLRRFVQHMKKQPDIRFVTAQELLGVYDSPTPKAINRKAVASHLNRHIVFGDIEGKSLSPAEMLMALLNVEPQTIDGPTAPGRTTYSRETIPAEAFRKASADAADFIRRFHRLPNDVFIGGETLSLPDFAATLAGSLEARGDVKMGRGNVEFDRYFASDGRKPFNWVIHPENFNASPLLDLGRLQGWTLKPAQLRR